MPVSPNIIIFPTMASSDMDSDCDESELEGSDDTGTQADISDSDE